MCKLGDHYRVKSLVNSVVNFITGLEEDIDILRSPVKVHSLILYHCSDYFKGAPPELKAEFKVRIIYDTNIKSCDGWLAVKESVDETRL